VLGKKAARKVHKQTRRKIQNATYRKLIASEESWDGAAVVQRVESPLGLADGLVEAALAVAWL